MASLECGCAETKTWDVCFFLWKDAENGTFVTAKTCGNGLLQSSMKIVPANLRSHKVFNPREIWVYNKCQLFGGQTATTYQQNNPIENNRHTPEQCCFINTLFHRFSPVHFDWSYHHQFAWSLRVLALLATVSNVKTQSSHTFFFIVAMCCALRWILACMVISLCTSS